MKKKLALKIGTSTLTGGTEMISRGKIENIARQINELKDEYDIMIISSGAVAAAKQFDKLFGDNDKTIDLKQALSAIGQPKLMQLYIEVFSDFGLKACQCLLTHYDFENETARKNIYNTITVLLEHGYIPIINENDTVAVEELIVGDNDKLSALVAVLIDVDKLFIASDIDGIFDSNPHFNKNAKLIEEVTDIDLVKSYIDEKEGGQGTGGMTSKIKALEICMNSDIEVYILNGAHDFFLKKALNKEIPFTKFKGSSKKN